MKADRNSFIDYIKKYCWFLGTERTIDGTIFLTEDGYDLGDLSETEIVDEGIRFDHPEEVDAFISELVEESGHRKPNITYKDYLKKDKA